MKKCLWEICGNKLVSLFVEAESFDEAIKIAREKNPEYCCGRIVTTNFTVKENGETI